ncbi:YbaK/EbsC family protein [Rhodobacter sp. NSM]|uniref:YbaK/EbsC family protein n=1 Tax=Rhodobacter sp. NSM TaxID=3457501 RepID=UPI003FD1B546
MSRSLARVKAALEAAGVETNILEMPAETRTAEQAAAAAGCTLDQIVKSILFQGRESGRLHLFLTAGGNRVCSEKAGRLAGEPLGRADAAAVRAQSGFAIGGVAPVGHLSPVPVCLDPRLLEFPLVWAAGGTPRHIFAVPPDVLHRLTGARVEPFTE